MRLLLLLVGLALIPMPSSADSRRLFDGPMGFSTGGDVGAVAVGDLDRDGRLDVICANRQPGSVSFLRGTADGMFAAPVTYPADPLSYSIVVADLDADGILDVATGCEDVGYPRLTVRLGQPDGSLGAARTFGCGTMPHAIAAGDLDEDGHADLVTANAGSYSLSILRGVGDGTFLPAVSIPVASRFGDPERPYSVRIADLDGDGHVDIATASYGGGLSVLLGHGDGTFGEPLKSGVGAITEDVVVQDFNRDGRLDLVAAGTGSSKIFLLQGAGDGSFAPAGDYPAGMVERVAIADLEHDGIPDVIAATTGEGVRLYHGDGLGGFAPGQSVYTGGDVWGIASGDFDQDGNTDFALANRGAFGVTILYGDGQGSIHRPSEIASHSEVESSALGDFNGDGAPDLVLASWRTTVALTGANGILGPGVDYSLTPDDSRAGDNLVVGDFDGDGVRDLASSTPFGVTVVRGFGDGSFAAGVVSLTPGYDDAVRREGIAAADFDGDHKLDVVVARGSGRLRIVRGHGDGTLESATELDAGANIRSVVTGDFNRDGRTDVACARVSGGIAIFLNRGDLVFDRIADAGGGVEAWGMTTGDIDNDGILDVALAVIYQGNAVVVLHGLGDGTFAAPAILPVQIGPNMIAIDDLDRDGNPDIVGATSNGTALVLLGHGDRSFEPAVEYGGGSDAQSLSIADLDGDAWPEVVVANRNIGFATILHHRGAGIVAAPPSAPSTGIARVSVVPNPARSSVMIQVTDMGAVTVFDVAGRRIRSFGASHGPVRWDRLDDRGRSVPKGLYFIRATYSDRPTATARVLLLD